MGEPIREQYAQHSAHDEPPSQLVGESAAMRALRRVVQVVGRTGASVLITGETGTGKGLVARCLHAARGRGAFVHVDCAALSPSVIESELFGHERGAFTGALSLRRGRLEGAGEGTVFLDEIAEVDVALQAKLLRVLQDRCFERVGGARTLAFRARVVAATNRELADEIAAGSFRADLYYRLQVVEIRVPPLRERRDDVELLFRWALGCGSARRVPQWSPDFARGLREHDWPGNVRELMNLAERLSVSGASEPWGREHLEAAFQGPARAPAVPREGSAASTRAEFEARERAELAAQLEMHRWNISAAARALGLTRGTLRGRMARLGLG